MNAEKRNEIAAKIAEKFVTENFNPPSFMNIEDVKALKDANKNEMQGTIVTILTELDNDYVLIDRSAVSNMIEKMGASLTDMINILGTINNTL